MTKASEARSALRRIVLTKVADAYEDAINGYANAYNRKGSIIAPGVRMAANANLRAQGYRPVQPAAPKPVARPNVVTPAERMKAGAWRGLKTVLFRRGLNAEDDRIMARYARRGKAVASQVINAVSSIFK